MTAASATTRLRTHQLRNLLAMARGDGLRAQLLRGGTGSITLKLANTFLALGATILLARTLGPGSYGIYAYVLALVSLLAIPAQFGLPMLIVRETAKTHVSEQWALMSGLWRWANLAAGVLALILTMIAAIFATLYAEHFSASQLITFAWGLALVPLIALGSIRGAALRGLRKVVQGQLPEQLLRPGLLVLFVVIALLVGDNDFTADQAMALHVLAAAIAFAIAAWLLRRERPAAMATRLAPVYESRLWFKSTLPLAFVAGMTLINTQTDIIMLGCFTTSQDVGVYRVAAQGATLVSFGLSAIGMVTLPHFARFHASGDMPRFQRLATTGARASLLLALPIVIAFVLFGGLILRTVFGASYTAGYSSLAVLALAQLVHAAFGTVGPLLNMAGHEKDTARGIVIAAACNVILNLLLIPDFGMEGAALATAITLVIWNVTLWIAVRRRLGVDSSALKLTSFQRT